MKVYVISAADDDATISRKLSEIDTLAVVVIPDEKIIIRKYIKQIETTMRNIVIMTNWQFNSRQFRIPTDE